MPASHIKKRLNPGGGPTLFWGQDRWAEGRKEASGTQGHRSIPPKKRPHTVAVALIERRAPVSALYYLSRLPRSPFERLKG